MKQVSTAFFLILWAAAFSFPLVACRILVPLHLVTYAAFNIGFEQRMPTPLPSLRPSSPHHVALRRLGGEAEAWYNDSFPWRTELLHVHRRVMFIKLKSPVGRSVPARGGWIFMRGGDWAELDDFLGAFELTDGELADWIALFEGHREWARAMGCAYLTLPAPVKAQVHCEKIHPAIRRHRGRNVSAQVRAALADSPARDDVIFAHDAFADAVAAGREVFYDADHHPNAYGLWLLYDLLNRRLAELFPDRAGTPFPWYDEPPPEVRDGRLPGCWPHLMDKGANARTSIRLAVSSLGESVQERPSSGGTWRYPMCDVATRRAQGGLSLVMSHDSYMRFSLASWQQREADVRFPFATGVGRIRAFIFKRATPGFLESQTDDEVPDVIIDQFPECRLDGTARRYLDDNLRAAALFGRAAAPTDGRVPQAGDHLVVRVALDGVGSEGSKGDGSEDDGTPCVILRWNDREVARRMVRPGVRRAVFLDVVLPDDAEGPDGLSVALDEATASEKNVVWRLAPPPR